MAIILGIIVYRIISKLLDKISARLWNMKRLNEVDEMFVNNGKTDSNTIVCFKLKKLPYDKIKSYARDQFCKFRVTRVILSHAFGRYFWKQLSD